jgi:hypothetical protein
LLAGIRLVQRFYSPFAQTSNKVALGYTKKEQFLLLRKFSSKNVVYFWEKERESMFYVGFRLRHACFQAKNIGFSTFRPGMGFFNRSDLAEILQRFNNFHLRYKTGVLAVKEKRGLKFLLVERPALPLYSQAQVRAVISEPSQETKKKNNYYLVGMT